ncbi:MAG: phosphonate ABC transporter, permease protein PhnE [Desulfobacterales bacterium]
MKFNQHRRDERQEVSSARRAYHFRRLRWAALSWGILSGSFAVGLASLYVLNIRIERLSGMFGPLFRMVSQRLFPPDLGYMVDSTIGEAIIETLEMTCLGAFAGIMICIPLAWIAAWNITPSRRIWYPLGRMSLSIARAVPTLIWAMLLVVLLGFGPLAGIVALILETVGFAGKLFSEEVEAIDMQPIEAIRATGASELQVFLFGVLPQVKTAWLGIIIYNWDATLRASTILGFVGAGGLGLYLRATAQLMEYQKTMGIISLIICLVILSEMFSNAVRRRLF